MRLSNLFAVVALLFLPPQAWAGNLTVEGDLTVKSNLTATTIKLGTETRSTWPSDASAGGAIDLTNAVLDFTQAGQFFRITLTNNTIWAFTNHVAGRQVWLQITEDATGGWTNTWPTDSFWVGGWRGGVSLSPNSLSVFKILDNGTNWLALVEGLNYTATVSYALHFDGANNYARADVPALQSPWTVEFWMRSTGGDQTLLDQEPGWDSGWAFWQLGSAIRFAVFPDYVSNNIYLEGGDVSDGQWHHVAGTYNGSSIQLWIDGVSIGTASASYSPSSAAVAISGHPNGGPEWGGIIDEVRISSVVRSPSLATSFTVDSDTVAYWRFNEGEGGTVHDETNNYQLTLQGDPLPTWVEGR